MSLARIVITGTVKRNPEKRFSQNNFAVSSFVIDINPQDESLMRVVAFGNVADAVADSIKLGDVVIVEGRLQTESIKTQSGKDKKVVIINASSVDKVGSNASASVASAPQKSGESTPKQDKEQIVQFSSDEMTDDLLDPDEIPF